MGALADGYTSVRLGVPTIDRFFGTPPGQFACAGHPLLRRQAAQPVAKKTENYGFFSRLGRQFVNIKESS